MPAEAAIRPARPRDRATLLWNPHTHVTVIDNTVEGVRVHGGKDPSRPPPHQEVSAHALVDAHGAIWVEGFLSIDGGDVQGQVSRIDPETREVTGRVDLDEGVAIGGMAASDDAIWITTTNYEDRDDIVRIDPESLEITDTIELGGRGFSVLSAFGALWVEIVDYGSNVSGEIIRIDPEARQITDSIPLTSNPFGIAAADDGSLWVPNGDVDAPIPWTIVRVDANEPEITDTIDLTSSYVSALAVIEDSVWLATPAPLSNDRPWSSSLARIDLDSREISSNVPVGPVSVDDLVGSEGDLWGAISFEEEEDAAEGLAGLIRVDVDAEQVSDPIDIGLGTAGNLVATEGSIWATLHSELIRIDTATNEIVQTFELDNENENDIWAAIAIQDAIWVTVDDKVIRIGD